MKDDKDGSTYVFYNVLQTDYYGKLPSNKHFNSQDTSGFHIIATSGNKASVSDVLYWSIK